MLGQNSDTDSINQRSYEAFISDQELPKSVVADKVYFGAEGLILTFKPYAAEENDDSCIVQLRYTSNPYLFRMIDEGDYLSTPGQVPHWLCRVRNSELLTWFNQESQGVHATQSLEHYAIYTPTMCYDIIHSELPRIQLRMETII